MRSICTFEKIDYRNSEVTTVIIECLAGDAFRQQVFGNHQGSQKWLAIPSRDMIGFTRKTLVNLDG